MLTLLWDTGDAALYSPLLTLAHPAGRRCVQRIGSGTSRLRASLIILVLPQPDPALLLLHPQSGLFRGQYHYFLAKSNAATSQRQRHKKAWESKHIF